MKRFCVYSILLFCFTISFAQDKVAYDTLYNRVINLPSEEVIKLGDNYLEKDYMDTAIVLYSIVYSRFHDGMSADDKGRKLLSMGH